ncbi:MAG: FAD-linked oxidase C-terminal domain-containing protein [Spirochaetia bacterium]
MKGATMEYNTINKKIVDELIGILGERNVITDHEKLETYSHDETPADVYGHMPDVAVTPTTSEEVAEVVKLANRELIPITPRGAGSGLSGGSIPHLGGISLSVEKMNKIIEIDYSNMVAVAEAGIVTNELNNAVAEKGLLFAGYPMSLQSCYLGGNIAENAGGGKAVKYGVTGRYIIGLELVTPTGDIVELGGKLSKDVTGYDLKQLIVGSEGTLGIVTKATVKLIGLPTAKGNLLCLFNSPQEAIDTVPILMGRGLVPTSIEFMDQSSVQTSCNYLNENLPYEDAGAMLLIELDGTDPEQVENDLETTGDILMDNGATEVYVADNSTTQERVWSVRRNIAEAFKVYSPVQSLEDIVVPYASIPDMIPELERLSKEFDTAIPCYGHAGDGNLHATLVKNPAHSEKYWHEIEPKILRELYRITHKLGGKISGEHGIGIKRKSYMAEIADPKELALMQGIKRAWDPNNIMNPGKIFELAPVGAPEVA